MLGQGHRGLTLLTYSASSQADGLLTFVQIANHLHRALTMWLGIYLFLEMPEFVLIFPCSPQQVSAKPRRSNKHPLCRSCAQHSLPRLPGGVKPQGPVCIASFAVVFQIIIPQKGSLNTFLQDSPSGEPTPKVILHSRISNLH